MRRRVIAAVAATFQFLGVAGSIGLAGAAMSACSRDRDGSERPAGESDRDGDPGLSAPRAPDASRRIVLALGDSLTAGYGLEQGRDAAWPALLQRRLDAAGIDAEVVNAGENGRTTSGGLSAIDWYLNRPERRDWPLAVVVVALGGNDVLRGIPPQTVEKNLAATIDKVRDRFPTCEVIVAGMKAPPQMGGDYVAEFEALFPRVAREKRAHLVPFLLEGVATDRDLNQRDGIHPTAEGQKVLAENVWPAVKEALGG